GVLRLGGSLADLDGADLDGADLAGADLDGADLDGADLDGADLGGTNGGVGGGSSRNWAPVRRIHIAEALSYRRAAPGRW
ncbi:MAG: pentapeptide repeat-containing protein, partial [Alphaproteobacteria bacterium]|nr:pentapeptide repeat-containing protein [Alphaproteobacteria bacterium]